MNLNPFRKRSVSLLAVVSLAAIPLVALAQGTPPSPPTTYYGSAAGATAGQAVVAMIGTGATTRYCGVGEVKNDPTDGIVYVVDVEQEATISGCGASGRQVRLYFAPTASAPGAFANQNLAWQSAGAQQQNVTLGATLGNRILAPGLRANP